MKRRKEKEKEEGSDEGSGANHEGEVGREKGRKLRVC